MKSSYFLFILIVLLTSCNSKPVSEQFSEFSDGKWNRFTSLKFDVNIDKAGDYDVVFVFRHTKSYEYSNMNIDVTYNSNDGESRTRPYNFILLNEAGSYKGTIVAEDVMEYRFDIFTELKVSKPGKISFEIDNVMPVYELNGVLGAGILLRPHKSMK
jgi:gliding motility-associated lipoprotein GldH